MQKDQFCNLTCHVARYMQLVGGEWIIFDLLNSYLAPRLGGIKQKKFVLFIASLKMISFALFPQALKPSMNFIISELFYCPARKFFWFQFLFVPYESSRRKSPAPLVTALSTHFPPPPTPNPIEGLISILSK